jgi:hypothetical protein
MLTATLPPVEVALPARSCGNEAGAVFVAVNHDAKQPGTAVPAWVTFPPEDFTTAVVPASDC